MSDMHQTFICMITIQLCNKTFPGSIQTQISRNQCECRNELLHKYDFTTIPKTVIGISFVGFDNKFWID